jgi:hypothetical protein
MSDQEWGGEINELRIQIYQYIGVFDEERLDMLVRHRFLYIMLLIERISLYFLCVLVP